MTVGTFLEVTFTALFVLQAQALWRLTHFDALCRIERRRITVV
jgi:hypothetical protein